MAGLNYWGDGSDWGDGDLYTSAVGTIVEYVAEQEVLCHRLSLKITYTPAGEADPFRVHLLRARAGQSDQRPFTYEAFIDKTTPSEFISVVLRHAGSEFWISHVQLIASRKRHQPHG